MGNRKWLLSDVVKSGKCLIYPAQDYNLYLAKSLKVIPQHAAMWIELNEKLNDTSNSCVQSGEGIAAEMDGKEYRTEIVGKTELKVENEY